MGYPLWCFSWTNTSLESGERAAQPHFCHTTLSSTRESAWDSILEAWFTKTNGNLSYFSHRTKREISRDAAIKFLKRRGGRVLKVKVALIGDFQT